MSLQRITIHCLAIIECALAFLIAGCSKQVDIPSEEVAAQLKLPLVAIFVERPNQKDDYGDFIGCGVLATAQRGGRQRYFILTASHIIKGFIDATAVQIGVLVKNDKARIKRLAAGPNTISWKDTNPNYDILLGDITDMIGPLASQGVETVFIDIDESPFYSYKEDAHILPNLGIAVMNQYPYLGMEQGTGATVVCADPGKTFLTNNITYEWTSPFVCKHGTLGKGLMEIEFIYQEDEWRENPYSPKFTVYQLNGDIIAGNSGAPIYFRGADGQYYFTGIVTGFDKCGIFYMTPLDFIIDYVNGVYEGSSD